MTIQNDYEVFKNALVYTITFRVTNYIFENRDKDVLPLAISAFIVTRLLQTTAVYIQTHRAEGDYITQPLMSLLFFITTTLISAGINMQSNLIGTYMSNMYKSETEPIYIAVSSVLGLSLIWVLGVSVGAI